MTRYKIVSRANTVALRLSVCQLDGPTFGSRRKRKYFHKYWIATNWCESVLRFRDDEYWSWKRSTDFFSQYNYEVIWFMVLSEISYRYFKPQGCQTGHCLLSLCGPQELDHLQPFLWRPKPGVFSWGGGPSPAVFLGWPKPANPNQTGFVSKPKQSTSTSTLFWQERYIYGFAEAYWANISSGYWFGTFSFIRRWKTKITCEMCECGEFSSVESGTLCFCMWKVESFHLYGKKDNRLLENISMLTL